ncbi:MAG: methionyl-tRNA formyltransferase [Treponema sp.]|nr:MAG: methionyl-tRNA formyltransferase [Treponema sp.]
MRLLFAGTPIFTAPVLEMLAEEFDLCAVLTNPPARKGRSKKLSPSDLAVEFSRLKNSGVIKKDTPLFETIAFDDEFKEKIKDLNLDLLICFAYGKIFKPDVISLFSLGGINIHPSILPRWRGATPVPAAICNGDKETGVTIQTLADKLDCGKILTCFKREIGRSTSKELLETLAKDSIPLLRDVLNNFSDYVKNAKEQDACSSTYCSVFKKNAGKINWEHSACEIDCLIRAVHTNPGAFSFFGTERINILEASVFEDEKFDEKKAKNEMTKSKEFGKILGVDSKAGILVQTGLGILAISRLQRPSKKPLFWKDFLNGFPKFVDGRFDN